jgi:hypothetical protein
MSQTDDRRPDEPTATDESTYREYVLGVRIAERETASGDTGYRFEGPHHEGAEFDSPEAAELYADVYFDVNGFDEDGVGPRGVPPAIIQAGRDTLVAYFLTQEYADELWIASYYGVTPEKVERYVERVRKRARKIREGAAERGLT